MLRRGAKQGELLVQELTGLPVEWLPLRANGTTIYSEHPHGEGYSLADWEKDRTLREAAPAFKDFLESNPRASFDDWHDWKKKGCVARVPMSRAESETYWREDKVDEHPGGRRVVIKCFRPEGLIASAVPGSNVRLKGTHLAPNMVKPIILADAIRLWKSLDTGKNALLTVGDGKTHATPIAAIAAASSGDCVMCFATTANTYTGNIVDSALDNISLIPDPSLGIHAIKLTAASGRVLFVSGNHGWYVEGFEVDGASGACTVGLYFNTGNGCIMARCKIHDFSDAGARIVAAGGGAVPGGAFDILSYSNDVGIATSTGPHHLLLHCTCPKNTSHGFQGNAANRCGVKACLAAGNGVDFTNCITLGSGWNVSADATAPGAGSSVSTFVTGDFTNYAGDDYSLASASGPARLIGNPLSMMDLEGNIRKQTTPIPYIQTGALDPDPVAGGGFPGRARMHNV